eukprot:8081823-Pyramimonas_sp.AAC.1
MGGVGGRAGPGTGRASPSRHAPPATSSSCAWLRPRLSLSTSASCLRFSTSSSDMKEPRSLSRASSDSTI